MRGGFYGGAANPLAHDASWTSFAAYSASHTNLQALRELDARGASFLRSVPSGDPALVLGSPDLQPLAEEAASDGAAAAPAAGSLGSSAIHHAHMGTSAPKGQTYSGGGSVGMECTAQAAAAAAAAPFTCKAQYFAV